MTLFFVIFWTVVIFASIAWYGFLLFYIGVKGGKEIRLMTRNLSERGERTNAGAESESERQ